VIDCSWHDGYLLWLKLCIFGDFRNEHMMCSLVDMMIPNRAQQYIPLTLA